MASKSDLEEAMLFAIRAAGLPEPVREYQFVPRRRFRFDFAWPDVRIALEVEGGTWNEGAHGRGSGIRRDVEKQNYAGLLHWRVFRATSDMVRDGTALDVIEAALRGGEPAGTLAWLVLEAAHA